MRQTVNLFPQGSAVRIRLSPPFFAGVAHLVDFAGVAHLVEPLPSKQMVAGSSPVSRFEFEMPT